MKTITFAIQKGGTGKTSVSVSVAGELALSGKKTLIIDADPQGNSTGWIFPEIEYELADVLKGTVKPEQAIKQTAIENLYILPTAGLGGGLRNFGETAPADKIYAIGNLLDEIKQFDFEYVIIDTSPSFTMLEKMCLVASNEVIAVLQLDIFSTDGLVTFADSLNSLKKNMRLQEPVFSKLILNSKDDRLQQQSQLLPQFEQNNGFDLFTIPVDQAFKKAQASQTLVQTLYGTKPVTLESLKNIATAIMKN